MLKPFVKWAGGKGKLLDTLHKNLPTTFGRYFEPFLGGGALFLSLLPEEAVISDINEELINCYKMISKEVDYLVADLLKHRNDKEYFYKIRDTDLLSLSTIERASRFIFLNKTCFNGLYRENKHGKFNTSFGYYKHPKIFDVYNLNQINNYLSGLNIFIKCQSYQDALKEPESGDFVYLDPPYAPMSKIANFTQYHKLGFNIHDQVELANLVTELDKKGVFIMLSNSNTPFIHELYKPFNINTISTSRSINCKGDKRGKEPNEVLITNY